MKTAAQTVLVWPRRPRTTPSGEPRGGTPRWYRAGKLMAAVGAVLLSASFLGMYGGPAQAGSGRLVSMSSSSSEHTYSWTDDRSDKVSGSYNTAALQNFHLTVSQTSNLTHQGVVLNWNGAPVTSVGEYATNYLQIMQCWGDTSPTPEQCQFGTPTAGVVGSLGSGPGSRDLSPGEDPLQAYNARTRVPVNDDNPYLVAYSYGFTPAPRDGVNGVKTFDFQQYFSSATSNEITAARTGEDGTGQITMEVQTALEAPHLGCGADSVVAGQTVPQKCWIVIVPRTDVNSNGSAAATNGGGRISGSPFSASNWRDRLAIPLTFQPLSNACPIGQQERRVAGTELVADAVTSWQPALCGTGTTYGFSQIGDDEARALITSDITDAPRMGFVAEPLASGQAGDAPIYYAPVAQSALVVAFNIDYNLSRTSSVFSKTGTPITNLVLNARLIAKMLTQSYQVDVPGYAADNPTVKNNNPFSIAVDPEFVALNPEFADWADGYPPGLLVPLGNSDVNKHLWAWLRADSKASAFLNGEPDNWGMKINPAYLSLRLAQGEVNASFPKADLTMARSTSDQGEPGYGTLDLRPYMNDLHESAQRTLRADGNVKSGWDSTKIPPRYTALPPQALGARFILAVTDSVSAARYGLQLAKLVNQNGDIVAPDSESILTGLSSRSSSAVPGVTVPNFSARVAGAYPLSELTYAVFNPCKADDKARSDYAKLLEYAVTDGQVPGLTKGYLPLGFIPLSDAQVAVAKSTEAAITDSKKLASSCPVASTISPTVTPPLVTTPTDPDGATTRVVVSGKLGPVTLIDESPRVSTILSAGSLALGLPLLATGMVMMRRSRKTP